MLQKNQTFNAALYLNSVVQMRLFNRTAKNQEMGSSSNMITPGNVQTRLINLQNSIISFNPKPIRDVVREISLEQPPGLRFSARNLFFSPFCLSNERLKHLPHWSKFRQRAYQTRNISINSSPCTSSRKRKVQGGKLLNSFFTKGIQ